MKKKRILVTGGAGFIGSNLVSQLSRQGHEIIILDNLSSGYRSNFEPFTHIKYFEGDIRDKVAVKKSITDCELVFHLAASVGNKRSIDNPLQDAEINVIGTINILEAARAAGVRKVIASSSAGIFGELKILPIKENHPIEPDTPYGCSKLCMEKECLAYAKVYNIETVCLRYFNVYGQNQRFDAYGNVIPIFVNQMIRNETLTIFGDGEQTRDFVNVRDVVQANIKAAFMSGVSGVYNIGSGKRISINALVDMIRKISGANIRIKYSTKREGDVMHSIADISSAREAFGFCPEVEIEKGLEEYIAWAKNEVAG